jgi:purine-binding chemotaxis protein CheW
MTEPAGGGALLARTRTRLCAIPLAHVVEVMRPLPVTPLSGSPGCVLGLALVRGAPTPVVDLGSLLFGAEPAEAARFVSLRLGEARGAVLALEQVLGVGALPESGTALPPLLAGASADAVAAVARLDAELLLVLEAARTVPNEVWRRLEADRRG